MKATPRIHFRIDEGPKSANHPAESVNEAKKDEGSGSKSVAADKDKATESKDLNLLLPIGGNSLMRLRIIRSGRKVGVSIGIGGSPF